MIDKISIEFQDCAIIFSATLLPSLENFEKKALLTCCYFVARCGVWCASATLSKEKGIQYFFYCDVPGYFRLEMWQKWQCCKLDKKARGNPLVLTECHDVWNVQHVVISEVVAECIPNWTVPLTRLWKGEWSIVTLETLNRVLPWNWKMVLWILPAYIQVFWRLYWWLIRP